MFHSIIKALGGFTSHEYDLLKFSEESWRTRAIAAETSMALFKEIMARDQARLDNLMNPPSPEMKVPPDIKPLGDRRLASWPRIKRELEKQNRVKSDAQVSREEIEKTIREG